MNDRKIRNAARQALRQLDLGARPDLNSIKSWLEANRGRPITIVELPTLYGHELCGMCVAYENLDVIAHAPTSSSWHRQQIILHEFAHLILGHHQTATTLNLVHLPGFPEQPLKVLGRSSFDDVDEAITEYLADLLAERIRRHLLAPPDGESGFNKIFG